jgi:hypothetical protein
MKFRSYSYTRTAHALLKYLTAGCANAPAGSEGALATRRTTRRAGQHHDKARPAKNQSDQRRGARATARSVVKVRYIGKSMKNRKVPPTPRPAPKAAPARRDAHSAVKDMIADCRIKKN